MTDESGIPAVLCLHAGASGPHTWDDLSRRLRGTGIGTRAPTLLGHLDAPRRPPYRLADFADVLLDEVVPGLGERFAIVGNSLGAFVGSLLAQRIPERISALVLEEMPVPRRSAADGSPISRRSSGMLMRALAPLGRRRFDPRMLRDVLDELDSPMPRWWDGLDALTMPTLLLAGGSRSHLDQGRFELLAGRLADARVHRIDTGHRIHSREPERYAQLVVPFLGDHAR